MPRSAMARTAPPILLFLVVLLLPGVPHPMTPPVPGSQILLRAPSSVGGASAPLTRSTPTFIASGLTVTGNFMPWVCQFCTWSGSESAFATEYAPYAMNMTQLSYEMYDLCTTTPYFCSRGYEGTSNDLTPFAHQYGIRALPMLTSATLSTIQGFVDTSSEWTPFVNQAITTATTYGYGGYNIDWEPSSDTTVAGGFEYAHFLDQFANATHAHGMILTVDFARWDPNFWNLGAFAQTTTDTFMDMNYECPGSTFTSYLSGDTSTFALAQLGEALDPESGCTDAQMVSLLGQVHSAGVTNTEWWALDDTTASLDNAHLWTAVHDFVYSGAYNATTSQSYSAGAWGLNTNENPTAGGGSLRLFTLGTDEQGFEDAEISGTQTVTSVNVTVAVNLNPSNYRIYEGNLSATGALLSSWQIPDVNGTLHLGTPPGATPTTSLFFELATAPGGTVGGYLSGGPGTYAFFGVSINGGGSPLPLSVTTLTASPATLTLGGSSYLNVSATGGTLPYSYAYSGLPAGCVSANTASLLCTPTSVGTFPVNGTVTDAGGQSASKTTPLTVNPATSGLAISSFSASPGTIALGGTSFLNTTVTGGTPPYTYLYSTLPGGCTTSNTPSLTCTPTSGGTFNVTVVVTDQGSQSVTDHTLLKVTIPSVYPKILSFTASPSNITLGSNTTLKVQVTGGTPPYTYIYTGLPPGCLTSNVSSLACTPTAVNTYSLLVGVTDRAGHSTFDGVQLTVIYSTPNPLAITAASVSPNPVEAGGTTYLSVTAQGGSGTYTYSYTGLPQGCASQSISTLSCTPPQSGKFNITVTVTDSQGHVTSTTLALTVMNPPTPSPLSSNWTDLLLLTVVIVALVGIIAVAVVRRRGRLRTPPEMTGGTERDPSYPGFENP